MIRPTVLLLLAYGTLAAAVLACLWLIQLAPLRLGWGRELVGAAIAIVAIVVGVHLARQWRASPAATDPSVSPAVRTDPFQREPASTPLPAAADMPELSQREREVLRHLAEGLSNKQLARVLSVSENTVKTHLANLYAKLGVGRRTEALAAARRNGLLG